MLHGQRLAQNCMNGLSFKRNWEAAGDWIFHIPWPSVSPRFLPFGCSEIRTTHFRWWCCRVWCHVIPGLWTCFAQHLHRYPWKYTYVIICVYDVYSMYAYVCMCMYIYTHLLCVCIYIFMNIHILCIYLWMTSNLTVTSLEWCSVRGVIPKWLNSSAISGCCMMLYVQKKNIHTV